MAAAVAMALLGLTVAWNLTTDDTTIGLSPGARSLPWPTEGQASVEVQGLGSLGTSGEQKPVPIASVTKVMTAYVILREHPLRGSDQGPGITVDSSAADGSTSPDESQVYLQEGQQLSERRLLELMLIPSGNNIARLLARWDAGSQRAFVHKMNRAAEALGMHHTTYTGASGYEATTRSTAVDQLKLARQVMKDKVFRTIVTKRTTKHPDTGETIHNTNTLLGHAGVIGLKTGSSTPAGGALLWAATAQSSKRLILGVVLQQQAGTNPQRGLDAALASSRELAEGVQKHLAAQARAE